MEWVDSRNKNFNKKIGRWRQQDPLGCYWNILDGTQWSLDLRQRQPGSEHKTEWGDTQKTQPWWCDNWWDRGLRSVGGERGHTLQLVWSPLFSIKCSSKSSTSPKSRKQSVLPTDSPTQEQTPVGNTKAGHRAQQIPPLCPHCVRLLFVSPAANLCIIPTESLAEHLSTEGMECVTPEGCLGHKED